MGYYAIFCPNCDELMLAAARCPHCEWIRPDDRAGIGEVVGAPVQLPLQPVHSAHLATGRNAVWVTGQQGNGGALAQVKWPAGSIQTHPLPPGRIAMDLCTASGLLLAGPNDLSTIPSKGKTVYAFDVQSDDLRWEYHLPGIYALSPITCTPDAALFVSDTEACHVLDLEQGHLRQTFFAWSDARFAPLADAERVIISGKLSAQGQPALAAFHPDTGQEIWRYDTNEALAMPPAQQAGIVCAPLVSGVICLDAHTGKPMWDAPYRPPRLTRKGALTSLPAMSATLALFGCGDLAPEKAGYALYALDVHTGKPAWKIPLAARMTLKPLVFGSMLVFIDEAGSLTAVDLESARQLWTAQIPGKPATVPAVLDDYIVIGTEAGKLFRVRFRPASSPPSRVPEYFTAQGDWSQAGVAYALRSDYSQAGECFIRAGDARHALKLFEKVGDSAGVARCYLLLQEWDQAIQVYEALGDQAAKAESLLKAGRFKEAARCFEASGDLAQAGSAYARAGLAIEAARCYATAGDNDLLAQLAQEAPNEQMARWLASTPHWPLAVEVYLQIKDGPAAARLCKERGDLRRAFDLWWQMESWEKCRALAQELGDLRAEAQVCLQQKQYGEAARLFEGLNQWEEALRYYEQAKMFEHSLRALSSLGRYEEAAGRLAAAGRHREAAEDYQKAAQQMLSTEIASREKAAGLWRKAAEHFALDGLKEQAQICLREAASLLSEPILVLVAVRIDTKLVVGNESQLEFTIANQGFGPARRVRILVTSKGFGYEQPCEVGNRLDILARDQSETIKAGLKPIVPGSGVELRLSLAYTTLPGKEETVGPFQAFVVVQRLEEALPMSIHIGSFEYIGSGGVHAQDAVMVRPSYHVSEAEGLDAISKNLGQVMRKNLKPENTQSGTIIRYCSRCGQSVQPDDVYCPNPNCGAEL